MYELDNNNSGFDKDVSQSLVDYHLWGPMSGWYKLICRTPFLPQSSKLGDQHRICWLAYPDAKL